MITRPNFDFLILDIETALSSETSVTLHLLIRSNYPEDSKFSSTAHLRTSNP